MKFQSHTILNWPSYHECLLIKWRMLLMPHVVVVMLKAPNATEKPLCVICVNTKHLRLMSCDFIFVNFTDHFMCVNNTCESLEFKKTQLLYVYYSVVRCYQTRSWMYGILDFMNIFLWIRLEYFVLSVFYYIYNLRRCTCMRYPCEFIPLYMLLLGWKHD